MMRMRCDMIDILWSDGWRLNMTMSPSFTWRSTLYPTCRIFDAFGFVRSMRMPSVRVMYRAPGSSDGPFSTSSCSCATFHGVTTSGYVSVRAIERGTPTSSIARLGSGVMTVRAEKSTRLPIRLPRTRPSFPLSRAEIDLSGRPDRPDAGVCPGIALSMMAARVPCSSRASCSWMWLGAPLFSWSRSALFCRTISE